MTSYTLPDTVKGGSITVQGSSLANAQQNAASATGASLSQQQGGGTFGANTTSGGDSGSSGGGGGGGSGAGPSLTNPAANTALLNAATAAATQAYLNAKLGLDTDTLAFNKATQAYTNTLNAAALTGTFEGQQTQAAQQQAYNQGVSTAALTGTYNGQQTQAAQKQAADIAAQQAATGLAATTQTQKTANDYLTLIAGLRGPQDYGQYLKTLGSTPAGLSDLVASAAGKYVPSTGSTTGVAPTPASLGGLVGDAATGSSSTAYGDYMTQANSLVAPNGIAPAAWNAYTDSQKKLLLGMYESSGYTVQDATDLYKQSLPKYAGPVGTGTVKM